MADNWLIHQVSKIHEGWCNFAASLMLETWILPLQSPWSTPSKDTFGHFDLMFGAVEEFAIPNFLPTPVAGKVLSWKIPSVWTAARVANTRISPRTDHLGKFVEGKVYHLGWLDAWRSTSRWFEISGWFLRSDWSIEACWNIEDRWFWRMAYLGWLQHETCRTNV